MDIKSTKYPLIFGLLLFCSEAISGDKISFSFACEILEQVMLESSGGKSKRYTGYRGKEKVGDNYNIGFEFVKSSKGYLIRIETEDDVIYFGDANESMVSGGIVSKRNNDKWLNLSADYFSMGSMKGVISGGRYYKNDWSLIYTGSSPLTGHLMALNCMSVSTSYDQIISHIVEFHASQK